MSRNQRIIRAAVVLIAATALTLLYLAVTDWLEWRPRCPLKWATGLSCPGCGSQRALVALAHGHFTEAVEVNLLLPFVAAYLAMIGFGWLFSDNRAVATIYRHITSGGAVMVVATIIIGWMIVRNVLGV